VCKLQDGKPVMQFNRRWPAAEGDPAAGANLGPIVSPPANLKNPVCLLV
jgi:hypothetical protein